MNTTIHYLIFFWIYTKKVQIVYPGKFLSEKYGCVQNSAFFNHPSQNLYDKIKGVVSMWPKLETPTRSLVKVHCVHPEKE